MSEPEEIWRVIPSWSDFAASDHGRIKILRDIPKRDGTRGPRKSGDILVQTPRGGMPNYLTVSVRREGECQSNEYVHALVCEAFNGPSPERKPCARHWDGNFRNNTPSNLLWGSHKENSDDRMRHGTMFYGSQTSVARLTEIDIPKIRDLLSKGCLQKEVALQFGVCTGTIGYISRGKTWKHVS